MKKLSLPIIITVLIVIATFLTATFNESESNPEIIDSAKENLINKSNNGTADVVEREVSDQDFFNDIFKRREKARAEGDVGTFNSLISERGLESQGLSRGDDADLAFSQNLINGFGTIEKLSIDKLPIVEFHPGATKTLLVYEGLVTTMAGEERFFTRLVEFILESGEWKVDHDYIDGTGGKPRKIPPPAPKITIEPIDQ
jgi:hypothetical protein